MSQCTLWDPPADVWETTQIGRFATQVGSEQLLSFQTYDDLWEWSVDDIEGFWTAVWDFFDLPGTGSGRPALGTTSMPFASWFPNRQLNYAEAMLRLQGRNDDDVVVRSRSQTTGDRDLTAAELRTLVARAQASLEARGVGRGDRVAAYLPNIPEALVVALACASLGVIYTACPPEFGTTNVVDRWSQIEPVVVFAVDGYLYGTREIDRLGTVQAITQAVGVEQVVLLRHLDHEREVPEGMVAWEDFLVDDAPTLKFERVPFDHPLWVLFSSGTTGLPKPILHGHGGVTLELSKLHGLQHNLGPQDTFFWYSTTGWVMWNLLVSGLLTSSTVVMFDGDPGAGSLRALWDVASDFKVSYFGGSAPFFMQCRKNGLVPTERRDLSTIREIGSTGAPLPVEGFEWLYEQFGPDLRVNSTSGGTDVCTSFVGGAPLLPVRLGVIAGRQLGCRVEAWSDDGESLIGEVGEMVVTAPMPSMPVGFWGDDDGARYRDAYFDRWPGVWRHGDWITIADDGHCVISGRSDATLNRGGVRFGTSEFYRVVEDLDSVADSIVVHVDSDQGESGELILFVVPADGRVLDDGLRAEIATALRSRLSPRHVPDAQVQIAVVPRTLSGKKLEVPVKRLLQGASVAAVADVGALADPAALDVFALLGEARTS